MPVLVSLRADAREAQLEAPRGARLYDLVRAAGWPLGSSCQGDGICARCGLRVLEGRGLLSPEGEREAKIKRDNRLDESLVISCLRGVAADEGALLLTTDYW